MKKNFSILALEKLTNGNTFALKELLEVFIKETTLQIQQLESFLANGHLETATTTAHKIKSSLTLLGLDKFRPLAEKIEMAEEKNKQTIQEDVVSMISLYKEINEELKRKLQELS